jgi:putative membrane protein
MPSDRRLHPLSILFNIGQQFGAMIIPVAVVLIGRGSDEDWWSVYALMFLVPYTAIAVGRYLSFRYRYDENELVVRRGFVFRNQRHIPYERIQNIDAVQKFFHRLTGVVEVRVQTGSGSEPEATLSVLALADLEEMRERVAAARHAAPAIADAPVDAPPSRLLLSLPPRELALYGIIENRGLVVIAAALGLLTEFSGTPQFIERAIGDQASRGLVRRAARAIFADNGPSLRLVFYGVAALLVFLIVSRLFSIVWALIRLQGYTLTQVGEDLRAQYGLFTRVTATVPRRRIQAITIRDTPLHRLLGRASIKVATAGGMAGGNERSPQHREWIAPIIKREDVPAFVASLLPGLDVSQLDWQGVHERAFRRVMFRGLVRTVVLGTLAVAGVGAQGFWLVGLLLALEIVRARKYVKNLAWTVTPEVVASREGAFVRVVTVAPLARIQAVERLESPFDRRTAMRRVHADTAGGGGVSVPYLPLSTADGLYATLASATANTAFRW